MGASVGVRACVCALPYTLSRFPKDSADLQSIEFPRFTPLGLILDRAKNPRLSSPGVHYTFSVFSGVL